MDFNYFLAILLSVCLISIDALMFTLSPGQKKCVKEEIHKDVLVMGDYELTEAADQKASVQVFDAKGHVLYNKDDATKGKFAFTTEDYDMFEICVETKMQAGGRGVDRQVFLNVKRGVEAKNYADIAKAEKLKPLEVELKKLEDLSDAVLKDFTYMRQREEQMRNTNESTHSRVLYFSIFSMCCLLGLATWQVLYLRRFFKAKKLIE